MFNISKFIRLIFTLASILGLSSCASYHDAKSIEPYRYELSDISHLPVNQGIKTNPCQAINKHVIAINRRGEFKPIQFEYGSLCSHKPELDVNKHLDTIIESFQKSGKKRLMLFIHGGMNKYASSIGRLDRDINKILKERPEDYPLFISWPSEPLDSYGDSINNSYQGTWDNDAYTYTAPFKFATDVAEIGVRSLLSYGKQGSLWLNSRCLSEYWAQHTPYCPQYSNDTVPSQDLNPTHDPCQDKSYLPDKYHCVPSDADTAKNFDFTLSRFKNLIFIPLKLASIPVIDSLGNRDWNSQISRVRFAFHKPCQDDFWGKGSCEDGVIKVFFEKLNHALPSFNRAAEITIIGHSMGTILASEIIGTFPDLPYRNIVFIGAAVSIREFQDTVFASLTRRYRNADSDKTFVCNKNTVDSPAITASSTKPFCFFNLSLHPYAEATEENLLGAAPSGSLLEWIDANFENPANITDRTLGRWGNIAPLRAFFDQSRDNNAAKELIGRYIIFKRFGLDADSPHTHGSLTNPEDCNSKTTCGFYWRPEYWL